MGISMYVIMAKRFLDGEGLFYSNVQTGFLASPFYFPGGTFIAILVQLFFNQGIEGIMILIASFMGVMTLFLFVRIAGERRKAEGLSDFSTCDFSVVFQWLSVSQTLCRGNAS